MVLYLSQHDNLYNKLVEIVGESNVSSDEADLYCYSFDKFSHPYIQSELRRYRPIAVVRPQNTSQVSRILAFANEKKIPVVPRGAGSSYTGSVNPIKGGIVLDLTRMNKIKKIDVDNLQVVVEPGVVKAKLDEALRPYGFFFPPDPGSEEYCTIGGMIATNAAGMRSVKYGVTRDYVLSLEVVLPNGEVIRTGAKTLKYSIGYDLTRLFVGSEGTLGVITEATLKILPLPEHRAVVLALYEDLKAATTIAVRLIKAKVIPSAVEFLDKFSIQVVNQYSKLGIPEVEAAVLIELDGSVEDVKAKLKKTVKIVLESGAVEVKTAEDPAEREKLWTARRDIGPAFLRLRPEIGDMSSGEDIVVPLSRLSEAILRTQKIREKYGVLLGLVGHAGDGNVHNVILINPLKMEEEFPRIRKVWEEVYLMALELGGALAGEHGIGLARKAFIEKQHGRGVEVMKTIKRALDPNNIMNPGKIFDLD